MVKNPFKILGKGWHRTSAKGLSSIKKAGYKGKNIKTLGNAVYFYNK